MPINLLTRGNLKLDKSIFGWSITPIKSCLNCKDCAKTCYAVRPYKMRPVVKQAWDRNFELAKSGEFIDYVIGQLLRSRSCKAVRIHVAGDFFSQEYINAWVKIIKAVKQKKGIRFYTYTKVMDRFDFTELKLYCNVINSITPLGVNYGDGDYVNRLYLQGYHICPSTQGEDVICGGSSKKSCNICQFQEKVCFVKH